MIGIAGTPFDIDSKAKAVQYAISIALGTDLNSKITVDLVLAASIYNFITERVNLPDVAKKPLEDTYAPLIKTIQEKLDKLGD